LVIRHYTRIALVEGVGAAINGGISVFYVSALHIAPLLMLPSVVVTLLLAGVTWTQWGRIRKLKEAMRVRE
jgi:hypothetical protein